MRTLTSITIGINVTVARVRTLAVAEDGRVLRTSAVSLPPAVRRPDGHSEQDPRAWWPAVERTLCEVTAELPRSEIGAVSVAAPGGTVLPVNRRGEPAGPALLADDLRGEPYNARATELGERRWHALGVTWRPTAAMGRVAWLADHARKAAGVRHVPEVIGLRLTGSAVAVDSSHALGTGYDALAEEWPREVFGGLGVPSKWLPKVVAPTTVLGTVSRVTAALTGLPAGCPVIAGMTGDCAFQIASGAVMPGQFVGVLDHTYELKGVTAALVPDPSGALYSHRHPDGWWLPVGASNIGDEAALDGRLDDAAEARGPAGIIEYPLRRKGERFPFVVPDAHGFTRAEPADEVELHRARLEGVAFVERLGLDHLRRLGIKPNTSLIAAGRGSRSPLWTRIRATVSGMELRVARHSDAAYGAALLAAGGIRPGGLSKVSKVCARMMEAGDPVEPVAAEREAMTASYHRFCTELHELGWIDDGLHRAAIHGEAATS